MDYFDLGKKYRGVLSNAFRGTKTRFCIISFSSDWLFPTSESLALVKALNSVNANVSFSAIETDKGHDSFLLNVPEFFRVVRNYLQGISRFI
jgi:homoserine O-acetyltransferase